MSPRATNLRSVLVCGLIFASGCGTVRPHNEYQKAASLIGQRTGAREVYDPAGDTLVAEKTTELLDDGLTVDEAVSVALLNNRAFQSAFLEIGVSKADFVQSKLFTNPSFSAGVMFPQGGGRSKLSGGFAQEVVDLWQIPVRKKVARARLEQTILMVVQSALDLTAETKTSYYHVLALQRAMVHEEENLELALRLAELAQRRFDAGETTILDLNLVQADRLDAQVKLVSLQRDERIAHAVLARTLGLAHWETAWRLTDALPETSEDLEDDLALLSRALEGRLDLQAASFDVEAAAKEVKQQVRGIFPSITAGFDVERPDRRAPKSLPWSPLGNLPVMGPDYQALSQQTPQQAGRDIFRSRQSFRRETARDFLTDRIDAKRGREFEKKQSVRFLFGPSLQLILPLWDQNRAQIAKARTIMLQKQKNYEELLQRVAEQVWQAAATARCANELHRSFAEETLPLAEQNLETAGRVYQAGEASILVLLDAQRSLIAQKQAYVTVLEDRAVALADLERAVGGSLAAPEAVEPTPQTMEPDQDE